jgi:hypothetical protein
MAARETGWWFKWGNAAQIAAALIAACGFGAILLQFIELRGNHQATSARQVYLGYLDLEFKYPEFAEPDYEAIKKSDLANRLRYESFVSYLLYACEESLAAFAAREEWRYTCEAEIKVHAPFLCEKVAGDPTFLRTYNSRTQTFVKAVMTAAGVSPPDCKTRKT